MQLFYSIEDTLKVTTTWVCLAKVAHLGGEFGENSAAKGTLCDSISVLTHFSVILYIIYRGIDD